MSMAGGFRLGPYEILGLIGVGGMGEVYRARDTRLPREVAIKVLPAAVAADSVRRQRFEREAHAVSQLSHPHICQLFDVGDADGRQFLVMEYLEGQTLADRLRKGRIPLDQSLQYAIQIAEALDAAHRRDIVHRDLKPGNVMLTKSGVKLLDFGVAKMKNVSGAGAGTSGGTADTVTLEGVLVGTLHYMAPEQLEAREADARSDLFAFGAVVYEMLTGRRAFAGETQSTVIAAVLESDPPPIAASVPVIPPVVDRFVTRCLAKEPDERWQTARDLVPPLQWIAAESRSGRDRRPVRSGRKRQLAGWTLLASGLTAMALIAMQYSKAPETAEPVRFSIQPPPMQNPYSLAVSPDGRMVTYTAQGDDGIARLYLRPIDSTTARPLPGTEDALHPFWSPDGTSIGFGVSGLTWELRTIEVSGGAPQKVSDLTAVFFGGSWSSQDVILFSAGGALFRVPATGGEATRITTPPSMNELAHYWPHFLPDGHHYLYLAWSTTRDGRRGTVFAGMLDSAERVQIMVAESSVAHALPGFLLFQREGTLLTQPFDRERLAVHGDVVRLVDGVIHNPATGRAAFAVSDQGTLVYREAAASPPRNALIRFDAAGLRESSILLRPPVTHLFRLSLDGKQLAFSPLAPGSPQLDLLAYDLESNQQRVLTGAAGINHWPVWSPDGSRLVFDSNRTGVHLLYEARSDGARPERLLLEPEPGVSYAALDWSRDGSVLVFQKRTRDQDHVSIWALPMTGPGTPFLYLDGLDPTNAALSPDKKWLAYVAQEGGTHQVFAQPFPDPSGGRHLLSREGGAFPRWSRDGRELYYFAPGGWIVAVPLDISGRFDVASSKPLFRTGISFPALSGSGFRGPGSPYDVTPDGRFLVMLLDSAVEDAPITVVLNWRAELEH